MPVHDIITIGASAGGVEALRTVVSQLPAGFNASIFVVMHVPARSRSVLPEILGRAGRLPADHARDGELIRPGRIYVAPPDHHLVVEQDHVHLNCGPKEQHHRPCINVLFRSAAAAYTSRVVGVVLTGELDDGTAGLWEIKRRGGITVVQHPEEAPYPSMPLSALREVEADYTVRTGEMGKLLESLTGTMSAKGERARHSMTAVSDGGAAQRQLTDLTCPDCRGTIWEVRRGTFKDYQCRVGHTFSSKTMLAQHLATEETTLYSAIVALSEGASLLQRLADELGGEKGEQFREQGRRRQAHADAVRQILNNSPDVTLE